MAVFHSERGRVHATLVWGASWRPPGFTVGPADARRYYPPDEVWLNTAGFLVAYLGKERSGGDWIEAPFFAVVVPYYVIIGISAVLPLRWLYLRRRRRHTPGGFAVVKAKKAG